MRWHASRVKMSNAAATFLEKRPTAAQPRLRIVGDAYLLCCMMTGMLCTYRKSLQRAGATFD